MAVPFGAEDLKKLKIFIDFVSGNPTILNAPPLNFVKEFIEKFGGKVPAGEYKMPGGGCPFGGGAADDVKSKPRPMESESDSEEVVPEVETESESDLELDMEGVIEGDSEEDQPMGDSSKTPTEEETDQASDLRSQAAAAFSDQKFQEAIDLYTKAIELNPGNALFHAKRGQAFLKLKKPNACIRDCDKALDLNCDSAAAYKFRGRAHRLLGNWELAAKDLRQACKLDFDEETDEWLREVTPNAKKIEQHRIKQERKKAEKELKMREERLHKAKEANRKAREQQKTEGGAESPGKHSFDFSEILKNWGDAEIMAAIKDIAANPANIEKYRSNPKFSKLIDMLQQMGKATKDGDLPKGFPGGFPGMPAGFDAGMAGTTPPPEPTKEPKAKKPDFVDDGLD